MMGADGGEKQVEFREEIVKRNAIIVTVQAFVIHYCCLYSCAVVLMGDIA